MKVLKIKETINEGKNLLFYNKSVNRCYDELKDDYLCVYFNEPIPIKGKLIEIINSISESNNHSLNYLTITELQDILIKDLKSDGLVIMFNNFDRLTYRTVQVYQHLNSLSNIQFICSFSKNFKPEIYPFFKEFVLVNKEKLKERVKNEINVTYPLYLAISFLSFLIYFKISTSVYSTILLIGGIWFAFITFRTLVYIGGRV